MQCFFKIFQFNLGGRKYYERILRIFLKDSHL